MTGGKETGQNLSHLPTESQKIEGRQLTEGIALQGGANSSANRRVSKESTDAVERRLYN